MPIVTLPKSSLIYMDNEKIEIEIPEKYIKKVNIHNIKKAKGLFKGKSIDPLGYQKDIRQEWE